MSRELRVGVTVEPSCTYLPDVELHTAVLAVEPELRVSSGSSERMPLAGRDYQVSLHGAGDWQLGITASPLR